MRNDLLPIKRLVLSPYVGDWCQLPYPGHPRGCPNYGKAERCPPKVPHITQYFDLSQPLYLVVEEFDLEFHAARMKAAHPQWSDRQCRCVLYWQNGVRKALKARTADAMRLLGCNAATACPEGMGVNVFVTAALSGLKLDKTQRIRIDRHIALIGSKAMGESEGMSRGMHPGREWYV